MSNVYELAKLNPAAFEHLVNYLVLKILGPGGTGFGPGADAGRDGFFEGVAPYPSAANYWAGQWYIQSKFHAPHLSINPQKWLISQIEEELKLFSNPKTHRVIPDNLIFATNIEPSATARTGSFDKIKAMVANFSRRNGKKVNCHVWGGQKILDYLSQFPDVADQYGHLLTPGHVLSKLYSQLNDKYADIKAVTEYLIVNQFSEQQFMKLDQAGSATDSRPGIQTLFIDLPFAVGDVPSGKTILQELALSSAQCQRHSLRKTYPDNWLNWSTQPCRARTIVVKGGPGQGKSTIGQYLSQIQRAALILQNDGLSVIERTKEKSLEIRSKSEPLGLWPIFPRIPIWVELKEFAQWYGEQPKGNPKNILTFVAVKIGSRIGQQVLEAMLKHALAHRAWLIIFDGLDEVPNDVKDAVAEEITYFVNEITVSTNADAMVVCTSRPQGYSGQFASLEGPVVTLARLDHETALRCAEPVVKLDRTADEAEMSMKILRSAAEAESVRELMTSPLQAHIMAIVVRDGGRPPERRWQLFDNFYQVMKKRESLKNFPNAGIAKILREDDKLLKSVHCRLGFVLHARAERSGGAETSLSRIEFRALIKEAVEQLEETNIEQTVELLMEATTERLVLVSTPENGDRVQFDIRQLQEFFAGEFLYRNVDAKELGDRLNVLCGDAHWREVMHFLLSGLFEENRNTEIAVAVQALQQLDQREDSYGSGTFSKRMARGALLAVRLLCEGVLEQDKRLRLQLKSVFQPVISILDNSNLRQLQIIAPPASKHWLVEFLINGLQDSNAVESIGAAIVLTSILYDNHPKANQVVDWLTGAPDVAIAATLDAANTTAVMNAFDGPSSRPPARLWVFRAVLRLMLSDRLIDIGYSTVHTALNILRSNDELAMKAAKIEELNVGEQALLIALLKAEKEEGIGVQKSSESRYGIITAFHFQGDWTTGVAADHSEIAKSVWEFDAARGAFEYYRRCYKFIHDRKIETLNSAISYTASLDLRMLAGLNSQIRAYIPICTQTFCFASSFMAADKVDVIISEKDYAQCRPSASFHLTNEKSTSSQWDKLLNDYPIIAMRVWFGLELGGIKAPAFSETTAGANKIVKLMERFPKQAMELILGWGKILELLPDARGRIIAIAKSAPRPLIEIDYWLTNEAGFSVIPRSDWPLLPHLACAIASAAHRNEGRSLFRPKRSNRNEWPRDTFVVDRIALIDLLNDPSITLPEKEACLSWLLVSNSSLAKNEIESLPPIFELIKSVFDITKNAWLLAPIVLWLDHTQTEKSNKAISLIGELSDLTRNDFARRSLIEGLLGRWRERSLAPANEAGVISKWLAYSYA